MRNASPLAGRFLRIVDDHARLTAVIDDDLSLTYDEFGRAVLAGADVIDAIGCPGDTPIAVRVSDSISSLIDLFATVMSGHPVVPVDAAHPPERVQAMVSTAGALAFPGHGTELPAAVQTRRVPDCTVLMFTSGSTGTPKAVRQGPQLWQQQADDLGTELGLKPGHTAALALPFSFGGGLDIAMATLLTGATLRLVDPRRTGVPGLLQMLRRERPHSLHLSPALLRTLTTHPDAAQGLTDPSSPLELVATCGEAVDARDVASLRAVEPSAVFVNRSGSSETGNLAFNTFEPHRQLPTGAIPVGRPARGKKVTIVDDEGNPLPEGEIGIVVVTSPYLALGYLDTEGTVDFDTVGALDVDTDGNPSAARIHRLGDRGRLHEGELHLMGRTDDTVKIRGYRVDVAEVTSALRAVDGIADAAVIARPVSSGIRTGTSELVAYLAPVAGDRPPAPAAVRAALARVLPPWMQPAHCVIVAELPRTERGKLNRAALPEPARRPHHVAPATRTERLLAPIWEDVLAIGDVGRDDDMLALGGDSLTALQMIERVNDSFATGLQPSDLVGAPTLQALAAVIDERSPAISTPARRSSRSTNPDVIDLSAPHAGPHDRRPVIVAVAGAGESAMAFGPLARRLADQRVIGIQAHALESRGFPDWTVRAAARRCARDVAAIAPDGPVRFIGHSLGGVIAMEAARILTDRGRHVTHIVCLDTIFTGPLAQRCAVDLPADHDDDIGDVPHAQVASPVSAGGRWRTRAALLTAGWWRRPAAAQWSLFHELGRRSALIHRYRPYAGAVTAVLAEDNPDPEQWWPLVATGALETHRIAGDHNGILRAPYVDRTAEIVRTVLTDVPA